MTKRSLTNIYETIAYNDFENEKSMQKEFNRIIGYRLYYCVHYNSYEDEATKKYTEYIAT
jgi:hypothetical protein